MRASLALAALVSRCALYSTLEHYSRGIGRVLVVIVACVAGTLWAEKGRMEGKWVSGGGRGVEGSVLQTGMVHD